MRHSSPNPLANSGPAVPPPFPESADLNATAAATSALRATTPVVPFTLATDHTVITSLIPTVATPSTTSATTTQTKKARPSKKILRYSYFFADNPLTMLSGGEERNRQEEAQDEDLFEGEMEQVFVPTVKSAATAHADATHATVIRDDGAEERDEDLERHPQEIDDDPFQIGVSLRAHAVAALSTSARLAAAAHTAAIRPIAITPPHPSTSFKAVPKPRMQPLLPPVPADVPLVKPIDIDVNKYIASLPPRFKTDHVKGPAHVRTNSVIEEEAAEKEHIQKYTASLHSPRFKIKQFDADTAKTLKEETVAQSLQREREEQAKARRNGWK